MHPHTEDLASKNQEKARNQSSTFCGKLRELLIRLFSTQRRSVLELIFKGCHGFNKPWESSGLFEKAWNSPDALWSKHSQVILRLNLDLPIHSSAPPYPYTMMEYPKKFRLGQNGTIGYQEFEHANNGSTDQTNTEGKVCLE